MLVAISIPIFSSRLENAREATDMANLRNAYAEITTSYLSDSSKSYSITVTLKQTKAKWQSAGDIAGVKIAGGDSEELPSSGTVDVSIDKDGVCKIGTVTIPGNTVTVTP